LSLYLLDTNTISDLVHRRSKKLQARIDSLAPGDSAAISVITEAEIRFGLACKPGAVRLAAVVELVLARFTILPWTSNAARVYARFRAENRRLGLAAGNLDMLIAAQAIASDATLVTADRALAKLAGGLKAENWTTDLRPN
jgi:tRNA(fMet)-specific endonuclease VapC